MNTIVSSPEIWNTGFKGSKNKFLNKSVMITDTKAIHTLILHLQ